MEAGSGGASRYRYGAFILFFLILLVVFSVKFFSVNTFSTNSIIPQDTERSVADRSTTEHFIMTGRIDINTADIEGLTLLPGVGEALAGKIVERRVRLGGFNSIDELLDVEGIGPKKLISIKGFFRSQAGI